MSAKHEWAEDSEAMSIAMEIVAKDEFAEMFEGLDLAKMRFLRIIGRKNGKACKVTSVGFPYNIDVPYLYYMEIDDEKWKQMDDHQRGLLVFRGLYEVSPGGMDPESVNYGKKRKKDVEDFSEVIAAAGGRIDWNVPGAAGLPDILAEKESAQ